MGKLGGRELTYGSDLDILFVFSESRAAAPPAGLTVFEYFSKVAEKTISYLSTLTREGFVFRVDTRLRPTGSKGPLVQSIDAFKNYYSTRRRPGNFRRCCGRGVWQGTAWWERILSSSIQELIYRDQDQTSLANDIISMRKRMEDEVGRESTAPTISNRAPAGWWTSSSLSSICSFSTGSSTTGSGSPEHIMPCGP